MNSKADTSVSFIIAFIIGIIVLAMAVFMIYSYYTTGSWFGIVGGKDNVSVNVKSCQVACVGGNFYDYCSKQRKIIFADANHVNGDFTCFGLETQAVGLEKCNNIDCTKPN